ncbi:uncharacterized protein TRIADDRAFT_19620 [Trichoplax adhaerens]|uniref:J domain-containing protein n=1 Tax=Trichoplax adhaerens TaxID=10228 RepID=B3RLQ1_TRIAD|nr:hypothetical protein TRIADDRAFT_19620 [Trichoplax adhaerens]EDV29566.1 hypothetical protein TRIADDRAFT_19620 [Trichoplax adhaerens]|eukprot:XP_002108768.1 hypothetical protein TRIADDRAFT_19620 [Trichoplax adhaerens]
MFFSTNDDSYYKVLGLEKGATEEEIRKAYKKMSLKHHPDKNLNDPNAADRFKEINQANQVLSNPSLKEIYDKYGMMGLFLAEQIGEEVNF